MSFKETEPVNATLLFASVTSLITFLLTAYPWKLVSGNSQGTLRSSSSENSHAAMSIVIALFVVAALGTWITSTMYFAYSIEDIHNNTKSVEHDLSMAHFRYTSDVYNEQFAIMVRNYIDYSNFNITYMVIAVLSILSISKMVAFKQMRKRGSATVADVTTLADDKGKPIPMDKIYGSIASIYVPLSLFVHFLNMVLYENNIYRKDTGIGKDAQPNSTISNDKWIISTISDSFLLFGIFLVLAARIMYAARGSFRMFGMNWEDIPTFIHENLMQGNTTGIVLDGKFSYFMSIAIVITDVYHVTVLYLCASQVFTWIICVPVISWLFTKLYYRFDKDRKETRKTGIFLFLYVLTNAIWYNGFWVLASAPLSTNTKEEIANIMLGSHTDGYEHVYYLTNFHDPEIGCRPTATTLMELQNMETVLLGMAAAKLVAVLGWPLEMILDMIMQMSSKTK